MITITCYAYQFRVMSNKRMTIEYEVIVKDQDAPYIQESERPLTDYERYWENCLAIAVGLGCCVALLVLIYCIN